jgi:hypothetical protein
MGKPLQVKRFGFRCGKHIGDGQQAKKFLALAA